MLPSFQALRACLLSAAFLGCLAPLSHASAADSPLEGHWELDRSRSDDPNSWRTITLAIDVEDDAISLRRTFIAMSRRQYVEEMKLDLSQDVTVVPMTFWPDNRYIGAAAGGEQERRVRASWLDHGRILRLDSDLTLSTQQGDRDVNILSDFKVSANGQQLTLIELRSTRNRPVVYVFKRATR